MEGETQVLARIAEALGDLNDDHLGRILLRTILLDLERTVIDAGHSGRVGSDETKLVVVVGILDIDAQVGLILLGGEATLVAAEGDALDRRTSGDAELIGRVDGLALRVLVVETDRHGIVGKVGRIEHLHAATR